MKDYYYNLCECRKLKYKYANYCKICSSLGKRNHNYGKKHSEKTRRLIGINSGKNRLGKRRKGLIAETDNQGRQRAERWFKLKPCIVCNNKKSERHHQDGNPKNNNPENILFVCRKHHQKIDGRLKNLKYGLRKISENRLKPFIAQEVLKL